MGVDRVRVPGRHVSREGRGGRVGPPLCPQHCGLTCQDLLSPSHFHAFSPAGQVEGTGPRGGPDWGRVLTFITPEEGTQGTEVPRTPPVYAPPSPHPQPLRRLVRSYPYPQPKEEPGRLYGLVLFVLLAIVAVPVLVLVVVLAFL